MDAAALPFGGSDEERRRAVRAAWLRLKRADLPREWHALAFRIMHGSLYVGAFLCHIRMLPPSESCCPHPACVAQQPSLLDNLTHAFITCPAVAPAAVWVCSVFAAVSGGPAPPVCPRVLLADEAAAWSPPRDLRHLWTHLRLAFLHGVWQLRARRSLAGVHLSPAAVCNAVLSGVRAAIQRDWARATHDMRRLNGTYAEWFRGRDTSISMAVFQRRWARDGVLCTVEGEGGLCVRFSLTQPVVPAFVGGGAAGAPGEPAPAAAGAPGSAAAAGGGSAAATMAGASTDASHPAYGVFGVRRRQRPRVPAGL